MDKGSFDARVRSGGTPCVPFWRRWSARWRSWIDFAGIEKARPDKFQEKSKRRPLPLGSGRLLGKQGKDGRAFKIFGMRGLRDANANANTNSNANANANA